MDALVANAFHDLVCLQERAKQLGLSVSVRMGTPLFVLERNGKGKILSDDYEDFSLMATYYMLAVEDERNEQEARG